METEDSGWRAYRYGLLVRHSWLPAILGVLWMAALFVFGEWRAAVAVGAVGAAVLFVLRRVVRDYTEPVARLSLAARSIASGNTDTHVPVGEGYPQPLSSALVDLRERMRACVEGLEAEERNLRVVLDGLPDAVFLLRAGRIVLANAEASRLFRPPTEGWDGLPLEAVLPASLASTLAAGTPAEPALAEEFGPDPAGRFLRAVHVPLEGATGASLAIVSDITERATVDAIRRDFVANASHELKTPAAGILLLAESAEAAISDGDSEQASTFVTRIAAEATHLRRLVLDLLDLSRLEAQPGPVAGMTDIRHAAELAVTAHAASAAERGIELRLTDEATTQDLFASADATDVAVALDNLLDNAISYTERGSVTLAVGAGTDTVVVTVTDTGIGIPPEELGRVFERFYRVDRVRSRVSGGTGLGLALVKHVVERSGGSVGVASEPGVGSTFTITLPRAR